MERTNECCHDDPHADAGAGTQEESLQRAVKVADVGVVGAVPLLPVALRRAHLVDPPPQLDHALLHHPPAPAARGDGNSDAGVRDERGTDHAAGRGPRIAGNRVQRYERKSRKRVLSTRTACCAEQQRIGSSDWPKEEDGWQVL
jgi:hypothetical protein